MSKKVDKWSTAVEVAEQIYAKFMENPDYSCEDAQNDFDVYSYGVIYCACTLVDSRLCLEGKAERLKWQV